jgi:hypothetical protein
MIHRPIRLLVSAKGPLSPSFARGFLPIKCYELFTPACAPSQPAPRSGIPSGEEGSFASHGRNIRIASVAHATKSGFVPKAGNILDTGVFGRAGRFCQIALCNFYALEARDCTFRPTHTSQLKFKFPRAVSSSSPQARLRRRHCRRFFIPEVNS